MKKKTRSKKSRDTVPLTAWVLSTTAAINEAKIKNKTFEKHFLKALENAWLKTNIVPLGFFFFKRLD